ncbi:hypothetical protein K6U06_01425 [Acidiferrimicrobium sp. IK]|uniref:hypothetical protein n=1 Tax=Acidiferrimicrobium sp. IK TaxID=2871700 RepID=UPI0021CB27FD|nr:hypothetical protein [Acidiferrimicrobium sp. IK]MCU4183006.1 hypothetical protein [Acidiferrimicrobium sp. IK]
MTNSKFGRLWVPLMAAIGGSAISLSVGLGQHHWEAIVIGETVTVLVVALMFAATAQDSDIGAVLAHRADERQELVRLQASRVSAFVAVTGSVMACVIAAARNATYWPYEAIYIAAGLAYLISIRFYGGSWKVSLPPETTKQ